MTIEQSLSGLAMGAIPGAIGVGRIVVWSARHRLPVAIVIRRGALL